MPVYQDREAPSFVVHPDGDYVLRVVGCDSKISTGEKTAGSPQWDLKVVVEGVAGNGHVFESLIDHETSAWKIDTFLKSTNSVPPKGAAFDFNEDAANAAGILFIDPIGLRGWAHLVVDEWKGKKRNKIGVWLTNKPKLPRATPEPKPQPASAPASAPATTSDDDDIPF